MSNCTRCGFAVTGPYRLVEYNLLHWQANGTDLPPWSGKLCSNCGVNLMKALWPTTKPPPKATTTAVGTGDTG